MKSYTMPMLGIALICLMAFTAPPVTAEPVAETYRLGNGMEIILKPNHSSPMIASVIFVKSGSKYESTYENGITHFLEHLLFDGTTHLTREQLDHSIRDLGGYINAFTRKDMTGYLVLLPKQYIDYGLAVQTDMLFNSVFPETELPKERKVVIEEINRDADAPGAQAEEFFTERAYANTDYSRPVLGYRGFIENIPRDAITAYWKKYYQPDRMTALIIGDFEPSEMKTKIEAIFGGIQKPDEAALTTDDVAAPEGLLSRSGGRVHGQAIFDTVASVTSTYINFSFDAPTVSDSDYLAIDLLAQYLALDEVSPLMRALKGGADPLATEVQVSLATYSEFTRLEVSAITEKSANRDTIVRTIISAIAGVAGQAADTEALDGIKTSVRCADIYNAEKLHYYGFMIAPMMMTVGWDFVQKYPDELAKVSWDQCKRAAERYFASPKYVATVVRPTSDSTVVGYKPLGLSSDQVTAYFASAKFPEIDLSRGARVDFPSTDSVRFDMVDKATYRRELLANGLTVIIKSSPDSRVFAVDVMGKNRAESEPDDKAGITDFVNRCLEKGTSAYSASEVTRALARMGANLTLYDNPFIPYDDRYTTPQFSFVKFETIEEFAHEGLDLLANLVMAPAFDSAEVENVRKGMLGTLMRESGSPGSVARSLFYNTLFGGKSFAKPVMGTPATVGSISVSDLRGHHERYYSPENMVVAVVTNRDPQEALGWIEGTFGRMNRSAQPAITRASQAEAVPATLNQHKELQKEQMSIYLGSPLPGDQSEDAPALEVAGSILSERLASTLREKQGLAYSVGASVLFDSAFGWYYCSMGTQASKYQEALDGMLLQIDKLRLDGPTPEEVSKARNQLWGRLMSAKLSRINQAYYMASDEYLGRQPGHDRTYLNSLSQVDVQRVRMVAAKYFRSDAYVLATAGKRPQ